MENLIKYIEYYEKYNFLFPNYTALPESEYLYQIIMARDMYETSPRLKKNLSSDCMGGLR